MGVEAARAVDTEIKKTEEDLKDAQERLREIRFVLGLPKDPNFLRMMELAEDPNAGVEADYFLKDHPDLA